MKRMIFMGLLLGLGLTSCQRAPLLSSVEVRQKLTELAQAAIKYAQRQTVPPIFPASTDWTPPGRACALPGQVFARDLAVWQTFPWNELGFAVKSRSYYQFRMTRLGAGPTERLIIEARGDQNCNNMFSHYTMAIDDKFHQQAVQVERENE